jgi:acetolactate synthase I/II/III large subunit
MGEAATRYGDPMATGSVAHEFLRALHRSGVEKVFAIAGTDFAPLIEAWLSDEPDDDTAGEPLAAPVLVAHEAVAVGMAHGAWLATGLPQGVMVHVSVGTANALCAIMNAARDRVPLLFAAGRTPLTEAGRLGSRDVHIHWGQELFDQAAMLRELVKWDYELRDGVSPEAVVARAVAVSLSEPAGPVYLSLPREVLAEAVDPAAAAPVQADRASPPHPDPAAVALLAEHVAAARFPLVIAGAAGHDPAVMPALAALCEQAGVGVVERTARAVHLPDAHPCHLGHRPDDVLARADVVIVLESDVPWFPARTTPGADAFVAHVGVDPLFITYPLRTHRADLAVSARPAALLTALARALEGRISEAERAARTGRLAAARAEVQAAVAAEAAADDAAGGPITKTTLSRSLAAVLPAEAVVVNEYPLARDHLPRSLPGTWLQHPTAGGLGWGLPAALGVQHALRDALVVAAVGDGAYLFANPAACHHAAAAHDLPVLTVVCTNRRWDAVRWSTTGMYPEGRAAVADELPLVSLEPVPDFVRYVEASGGWGARVELRGDLEDVLDRAVKVVCGERRQALVDVACA